MEVMQKFFTTTGAAGDHADPHIANCGACLKEKAMMTLIGGKEMDGLFKHHRVGGRRGQLQERNQESEGWHKSSNKPVDGSV